MKIPIATVLAAAGVLLWASAQDTDLPIRGFSPDAARSEHELEQKALAMPDPARLRAYMDRMAGEPHIAGSPQSREVAEYISGLLREWGLDAKVEQFEALLPYPTARSLEMTAPSHYRAKLQEPAIPEDPDSNDRHQVPPYNAYAASGEVTAPIVYVNYGVPEDYEQLKKAGVDVKGKIVLARYGKSWRGTKPKVAQEHGAVACLIYSDPRDDGYFQGDVYPKGPYRPRESVQRGSVMDMPLYPGDPLTPGWADEKGARRLSRDEAETLMKIPVLPISAADAEPLLENLAGAVVPEPWRGALPLTYHYGPGPAIVHLKVDFDWTVKPLYNVIATIPGSTYPNEWLIYGNHHDAWVNGANDPVSGTIVVLETARTLAELGKQGWRPKRTVKLAFWDAEEFGLIGSTEWVEKHRAELAAKTVTYINSDTNGAGKLHVAGSPTLQVFLGEVLRDIKDPASNKPLLEVTRSRVGSAMTRDSKETKDDGEFELGTLGAGSDYVAFYHHAGIASLNAGFSDPGSGGVYHSIYDSIHWFTTFQDRDLRYGRALTQVMTTSLLRLAGSELLPFEFNTLAITVSRQMEDARKLKGGEEVKFGELLDELSALRKAGDAYEAEVRRGGWQRGSREDLERINKVLFQSERALAPEPGLPGRTWYRNRLAAPGVYTGYSAKSLPAVREAIETSQLEEANREVVPIVAALKDLRGRVEQATRLLAGLQ